MVVAIFSSYPQSPTALAAVADDVPGAAAALATEGSRVVRRQPPHNAASSLVGIGSPGSLDVQMRSLNSPLLLLDYPFASPFPLLFQCHSLLPLEETTVRFKFRESREYIMVAAARNRPPPPSPPSAD